ncbi:hypothetical protein ACFLYX_01755 [Chloroflexota bacterium]
MVNIVQRVDYYYTEIPNRAGVGAEVLNALKTVGVNLIVYNGFPASTQSAQLVFVPADRDAFFVAAQKAGIKLVGPNVAFLIQGEDRLGAVADVVNKVGQARINITAIQAIAAGEGRYGAIIWVKPQDVGKTAQILGVS